MANVSNLAFRLAFSLSNMCNSFRALLALIASAIVFFDFCFFSTYYFHAFLLALHSFISSACCFIFNYFYCCYFFSVFLFFVFINLVMCIYSLCLSFLWCVLKRGGELEEYPEGRILLYNSF